MDTDTRGEQMIQGLAFEVEAIPQEDTIHVRSPANMTPITVKIRVRKREDGGVQKGLISVPKFGPIDSDHERIRLVSSDQTIMSFNMLMEADLERKPLRKPRKRFFGGCLGTQADDDDGPYVPSTIDTRESKSETGMVNTKLMLTDTGDDYDTYVMARKDKKFFGSKCKPGGCLDPPFDEEKYPYLPTPLKQTLRTQNEKLVIVESPEDKKMQAQSPVLIKVVPRKQRKSSDSTSIKTSDKEDPDDSTILSLYKVDATKATLDENESDHIITYPAELSSSEQRIDDERRRHSRSSSASKSRKSFNEINTTYFSPKREKIKSSSRENSSDRNISLLRKGITKDKVKVPVDKENTRQGRTISNVTQDKMVTAANVLPHILRIADYADPLVNTYSNEEADMSFNKKTTIKLEDDISNEEQKELSEKLNKDDHKRVAMRGRPQMPRLGANYISDMDADHNSDVSATDETANINSSVNNHQDNLTGKPNGFTNDDKQSLKKNDQIDPYSGNNALRSLGPNYRKPSSIVGKDKYTMDVEPGDRKNYEGMSPEIHSLASNISENYGTYNVKHSNLIGQDKSRKHSESGSREERQNRSSLAAKNSDSYSYGSSGPFYSGRKQSSLEEKDKIKLKNEGKNFKPQKTITVSDGAGSQDRNNSDDTENGKQTEIQSNNASLQKTAELTQKASREILSAVALRKVQQYGETDQPEIGDEPTLASETQQSQDNDFKKQEFETAVEIQSPKSVESNAEENAHKKESHDTSHGLTNEKVASMSSDSLPKALPGTSFDEHNDILDQIKKLKATGAASEGEDINEEIRKKLPANVDINEIIDTPSQLNIMSEDHTTNIKVTNSGTEIQISPKDLIKKEETPSSKNRIEKDKSGQQQTTDGVFFGSQSSFPTRTELPDTYYTDEHYIPISMKETGSNESLHKFDTNSKTVISTTGLQGITVSEKSDENTELDVQKTPMKMKDAKYLANISQGQQKERTPLQEGIITKPIISSLVKDSIMLDFAFTSFLNDKDEKVIKTLESSVDTQTMNNVVVVKTAVKLDSKDLRIPVDYDNYMSIKIKKARKESDRNKSDPTSLEHLTSESPQLDVGAQASPSKLDADVSDNKRDATAIKAKEPRANKGIDKNMQESVQRNRLKETLMSIYERELIPLQNTIKSLQYDIDVLAEQQTKFRDTVQAVKMIRPTRLILCNKRSDVNKRCGGCFKK